MVIIFTFSSDNARPFTFACRSRRRRCEMRMNRTCSDDVDEGDDERESHAHLLTGRRQLTVSAISSRLKQDKRMCLLRFVLTGPPGAGKSTFFEISGLLLSARDVTYDPSALFRPSILFNYY